MAYNAGFDVGSLNPVVNKFLEDHKASLGTYVTDRVCRVETVTDPEGIFERWETPVEMASDEGKSSKHPAGTSTPKGNSKLGSRQYSIQTYSWGEPINHIAKKALESRKGQFSKLTRKSAHQVQKDKDKDLAVILSGQGSAALSQDVTAKIVNNAWDAVGGTPISDIDDVVLALRGADSGLVCIAGWDVLLDLCRNEEMINNADKSHIGIDDVIEQIMKRGIARVEVDYNPTNANGVNQGRSYRGLLDGIFYIGTDGNLVKPQMNPLAMDVYEDKDTRQQILRAAEDSVICTEYAEHGYAFQGIQT